MAKIDTAKIEGYDTMSAEEKLTALESYEFDDHSGEVENLRNAISKANGDAADWKRKHHELLSAEEKAKVEREEHDAQIQAELDELRQDKAISGYKANFLANGYSEELAASSAKAMATGDTDTVFANSKIFKDELMKSVKADMLKSTPHPKTGNAEQTNDDLIAKINKATEDGDAALASHYIRELAKRNAENNK